MAQRRLNSFYRLSSSTGSWPDFIATHKYRRPTGICSTQESLRLVIKIPMCFGVTFSRSGATFTTTGSAQYYNSFGYQSEAGIWGVHSITDKATSGYLAAATFSTPRGVWAGTLSASVPTVIDRTCYQGYVDM